jgi:opacity protein-like surface antigen
MTRELASSLGRNEHENSEAIENKDAATAKGEWRSLGRFMMPASLALLVTLLLLSNPASAQIFDLDNAEFGGGYSHISGDAGLNGGNLNAGLWFGRRVSLAFDYDTVWNNQVLGTFVLSSLPVTRVRTHQQNFLIGPRVFFESRKLAKYHLDPFAEVQIGATHENQQVSQASAATLSASGNSYSWLIGGGTDYGFTDHWTGRFKLDFFRTHIAATGQTRARLSLGVAYTFKKKGGKY